MTGLTFDEATHTYRYNGVIVPSVTQILKGVGLIDENRWATDWHMTRGRYIHKATELWDQGRLDMDSVGPEIAGYVESYIKFRKASKNIEIKGIEKRVYSHEYGFAGTYDRDAEVNVYPSLIDIKSGEPADWHGYQLAGYDIAEGRRFLKRFGLYVKKDGKIARLIPYEKESDYDRFLSAVKEYNEKNLN